VIPGGPTPRADQKHTRWLRLQKTLVKFSRDVFNKKHQKQKRKTTALSQKLSGQGQVRKSESRGKDKEREFWLLFCARISFTNDFGHSDRN